VRNRGYIITVSVQALTIDRTLTPQALADFLRQKNAPHGDIAAGYYKPSDQRWMDELFGDSAIQLQTSSESAPDTTIRDAVDFDTAPRPKLGFGVLGQAMEYPASAKADSVEGRVLVELRIGTTGAVIASRIIRGVRPDLDSAAIRALRKLEWIPAMKSGSPVEVTVVMPIEYRLQ